MIDLQEISDEMYDMVSDYFEDQIIKLSKKKEIKRVWDFDANKLRELLKQNGKTVNDLKKKLDDIESEKYEYLMAASTFDRFMIAPDKKNHQKPTDKDLALIVEAYNALMPDESHYITPETLCNSYGSAYRIAKSIEEGAALAHEESGKTFIGEVNKIFDEIESLYMMMSLQEQAKVLAYIDLIFMLDSHTISFMYAYIFHNNAKDELASITRKADINLDKMLYNVDKYQKFYELLDDEKVQNKVSALLASVENVTPDNLWLILEEHIINGLNALLMDYKFYLQYLKEIYSGICMFSLAEKEDWLIAIAFMQLEELGDLKQVLYENIDKFSPQ